MHPRVPLRDPRALASPRRRPLLLLALACAALAACQSRTREAKRLQRECDAGSAQACARFALKLQKGEYVLRDESRAATL
jgi:hypothetical protein